MHHLACWEQSGHCGAYLCAPASRRVEPRALESRLVISAEELSSAVPLAARRVVPAGSVPGASPGPAPPAQPRVSRLAIASFITAIAGIPLFGFVTGAVAVVLAAIALGGLRTNGRKGLGWALSGLLIGLADVVGWLVLMSFVLSNTNTVGLVDLGDAEPDFAVEDMAPKIQRAMRANVLIERQAGWVGKAMGSGVILALDRGEAVIVTNRHVVDSTFPGHDEPPELDAVNKDGLKVKLLGQPVRNGRVDWIAPGGIDLALMRVPCDESKTQPALWAAHHVAHVGDPVFAIGNPQGLSWTHTQGVLSQFRAMDQNGRVVRVVQTQAPINPGNSGGGLYSDDGYLIGINTWTQDKRVSEGLSFAIAFDTLLDLGPPGLEIPFPTEPLDDFPLR